MSGATGRIGFIAVATFALLAIPSDAWAWGAGMHIVQGSFVLENLGLIAPQVAAILAANPMDYLYGCISADIFIGKGYQRSDDHCHNWSVGKGILEAADSESTQAYAYGYLSHLAADVVAHNYLIPNLLYVTRSTPTLGHVYWEFRADRYIGKKFWQIASQVVMRHHHHNDDLIKRTLKNRHYTFLPKKMAFKRAVRLSDLTAWQEELAQTRPDNRWLTRERSSRLNNHALNLVIDLLRSGDGSVGMTFDPVGTDNTIAAKELRRSDKKLRTHSKRAEMFPIPDEITRLDYVDHAIIRF